jgi:hypothetical protein
MAFEARGGSFSPVPLYYFQTHCPLIPKTFLLRKFVSGSDKIIPSIPGKNSQCPEQLGCC